jgi:DNA-binding response OmpR family regulator
VLVIEDDAGVAEILLRSLRSGGYRAEVASEGLHGLELALQGSFALVILDLLLPDVDGLSVLRRLVARRPEQQVIVLSSLSNAETKVRCLDAGASDYLAKPFALHEFAARVRAQVRSARIQSGDHSFEGGTMLDLVRREAIFDGQVTRLSQREFLLLDYLLRRRGEVCTRREILASVWNIAFDPGTNVVDVYIRRLRRKIGEMRIETVRNAGYRFLSA